jgi:Class III cytochrome C family
MKRFLITAGMLVTFLIAGLAIAQEKGPAKIELKGAKKAAVQFDHAKHSGMEGVACKKCHHKTEDGKTPGTCASCHDKPETKVKTKKAFHKTCKDCHKAKKKGPTKCKECHVKK